MFEKMGQRLLSAREKNARLRGLNAPLSFGLTSRWSIEKQILSGLEDDLPRGEIGEHLYYVLRIAVPESASFRDVTGRDLRTWNLSFADACQIAMQTVRQPVFEVTCAGDDKFWSPAEKKQDIISALLEPPTLDVQGELILWPLSSDNLVAFGTNSLLALGSKMTDIESSSELPPFPLFVENENLKNWQPAENRRGNWPLDLWVADQQRQYLQEIYTEQRVIFNEANPKGQYIVRYVNHYDSKKHMFSTAVIREGNDAWLPKTDQVRFKDRDGAVIAEVTWDEFLELCPASITEIGTYPVRYRYNGFLTEHQLRQTMRMRRKRPIRTCTCCSLKPLTAEIRRPRQRFTR